jgi:alpha-glucosidase
MRHLKMPFLHHNPALFTMALITALPPLHAARWEVTSPSENVSLSVELAKPSDSRAYPNRPRLYYQVEQGAPGSRSVVIAQSPLGLLLKEDDLLDGLRFESAETPRLVEETYSMIRGKRHRRYSAATAATLRFRNQQGTMLELDLRAYDDGVAFRYRVSGPNAELRTLQSEATGFALPPDAHLWMQPSDKVSTYSPAYETYYENGVSVGTPSPTGLGWSFPVLFGTADNKHWGLVTEANLGPNYFGARLTNPRTNGLFQIRLPDPSEGHGYGPLEPSSALPWEMPWRVVILGDSPGTIVESTLVEDLSAPATLADTNWIRPGRVAWSWWSDQVSPRDGGKQKRFIDFAAEMGWEYVLVDANWPIMDNGNIHEVIRYAKQKGVGVLLWYNTGGANNVVTEKPRGSLFYPEVRRFELQKLKEWGVKGIKVDFFQSDKPALIKLYHDILKDAAEFQIMVNFHGCTVPRGWTRTYPNLMSMEAVRGEECYLFDPLFPERAPVQNTITPFTRNAVGPMDYTPMALSNGKYPHETTYAHELALTVLFESGWVHFADDPDVYRKLPDAPKQFIKDLPVTWDDTRFVAGYPGREVVIARRNGKTWFLAGVNGRKQKTQLELNLKRILGAGQYKLTLITDDPDQAQHFASDTRAFRANDALPVSLLPYGGFVARFDPAP